MYSITSKNRDLIFCMLNHVLNCFFIIAYSKNILNWKNANLLWYPFEDSLTYLHLALFHMILRHQLEFCKIYKFIRPKWFDNLFELIQYLILVLMITILNAIANRLKLLPLNHITFNSILLHLHSHCLIMHSWREMVVLY